MKSELNLKNKTLLNLCQVFLRFSSREEVRDFLVDLCTPNELESLADRWEVAIRLNKGESYREISKETGISTATITRVGRFMRLGKGYQTAFSLRSYDRVSSPRKPEKPKKLEKLDKLDKSDKSDSLGK